MVLLNGDGGGSRDAHDDGDGRHNSSSQTCNEDDHVNRKAGDAGCHTSAKQVDMSVDAWLKTLLLHLQRSVEMHISCALVPATTANNHDA